MLLQAIEKKMIIKVRVKKSVMKKNECLISFSKKYKQLKVVCNPPR